MRKTGGFWSFAYFADYCSRGIYFVTRCKENVYRRRWHIELFFKFLKHQLSTLWFFGRSKEAIYAQIASAFIVNNLLIYWYHQLQWEGSVLDLMRYISANLFQSASPDWRLGAAVGSETVGMRVEIPFKDGFQNASEHLLYTRLTRDGPYLLLRSSLTISRLHRQRSSADL